MTFDAYRMWTELTTWRQVFVQFDKDNNGYADATELRKIFKNIGEHITYNFLTITSTRFVT